MPAVSLLAAVTGTGTAAGLACVIAAFVLPPRATTAPPPRWRLLLTRWRVSGRTAAIAVAAGLAALAITGWPVAGLATVPAVITLPRILSRRPARARIATLEALESWTRRLADLLAASRGLEDAITHSAATAPPRRTSRVGMACTPKRCCSFGASSTLTLTSFSRPAISVASCSSAGLTMRHGPHHGAQRSISAGTDACSATSAKSSSPASTIQGSGWWQ